MVVSADQSDNMFTDAAMNAVTQQTNRDLTRADLPQQQQQPSSSSVQLPCSSPTKATPTIVNVVQATEDDSDDDLSPLQRTLKRNDLLAKPKAKAKGKAAATTTVVPPVQGRGSSGSVSGGVGGSGGKAVQTLCDEAVTLLQAVKNAGTFNDINEEGLVNMGKRLTTKGTQLLKKSSSTSEALELLSKVNTLKAQVLSVTDLVKAIGKFAKNRGSPSANFMLEKFQACVTAGVTIDMLPSSLASVRCLGDVYLSSTCQHYSEAVKMISSDGMSSRAPMLTAREEADLQQDMMTICGTEFIRHHSDKQFDKDTVFANMFTLLHQAMTVAFPTLKSKLQYKDMLSFFVRSALSLFIYH